MHFLKFPLAIAFKYEYYSDMRHILTGALIAIFSLFVAAAPSLSFAVNQGPRIKVRDGQSTNWSGYASMTNLQNPQPGSVSDVQGHWIVPTLTCDQNTTYSSAWVGIDGYSNSTVEQTGTEHDCINGSSSYYAWYEMYPKMSHRIPLTIHQGDEMFGEVHYAGGNNFVLTLRDVTTNLTYSTTQKAHANRQSAEWIVEAPSGGGVLPLADFGTLDLNSSQATINGHTGPVSDLAWQNDAITMTDSTGTIIKAQPSSLTNGGYNFSVVWHHN